MNRMDSPLPTSSALPRAWWNHPAVAVVLMGLLVVVVLGIRWRLREFPLERDEGEYAYMGRLILEGGAPYGEAANMKWPGTWLAYAGIMAVCGQTTAGIHLGLLGVSLVTSLLVFVLGRRLCGTVGGAVAAGTHAVLALGTPVLGFAAHANHFVVVCALGGFVVLTGRDRPGLARVFVAGLLFGLAGLMKQAGVLFGLLAFGGLLWCEVKRAREAAGWSGAVLRLAALGLGGLAPLGATALWIWKLGTWDSFWWWSVVYAKEYASLLTPKEGLAWFEKGMRALLNGAPWLWGAAACGAVGLFFRPALRAWRWGLVGFALVSFAAVCPGLFFRPHYFLLLLPAVALLAGVAVAEAADRLRERWPRWPVALLPLVLIMGGAFHAMWRERAVFFRLTPEQACRATYGYNLFPESMEIARYLRDHTAPDARLAILGSEPQILFYAHRRAATPYLYVYPLMEPQPLAIAMQQEFTQRIEAVDPDYVLMVGIEESWIRWPDSHMEIFTWLTGYLRRFHVVGLVDLHTDRPGDFRWFDGPTQDQPRSKWWVMVLRNNRLAPP